MTLFKEMVYSTEVNIEVLVDEVYKGYRYFIMSYGQYPCAYVVLEEWHFCYEKQCDSINVSCHGGITYSEFGFRGFGKPRLVENKYWVIGWDYCHYSDFHGTWLTKEDDDYLRVKSKKWTTQEIVDEAKSVIEQLDFIYDNTRVYA